MDIKLDTFGRDLSRLAIRSVKGAFSSVGLDVTRHISGFQQIANVLRPDDRPIVDVGAHLGETVAQLRTIFPSNPIYAVEPYPPFADKIEERFSADPTVTCHRLALSDRTGEAAMFTANLNLSLVSPMLNSGGGDESIRVRTQDLHDFCISHRIERIKLLKVDAEGHDLSVLQGGAKLFEAHVIDAAVVEVMFIPAFENQPLFPDIASFMAVHDYRLFGIVDVKKTSAGQFRYANALFLSSEVPVG